jgi:hypothetical protein
MLLCMLTGPYISLCPLTCDSAQGQRSEAGDREKVVSTYTPSVGPSQHPSVPRTPPPSLPPSLPPMTCPSNPPSRRTCQHTVTDRAAQSHYCRCQALFPTLHLDPSSRHRPALTSSPSIPSHLPPSVWPPHGAHTIVKDKATVEREHSIHHIFNPLSLLQTPLHSQHLITFHSINKKPFTRFSITSKISAMTYCLFHVTVWHVMFSYSHFCKFSTSYISSNSQPIA